MGSIMLKQKKRQHFISSSARVSCKAFMENMRVQFLNSSAANPPKLNLSILHGIFPRSLGHCAESTRLWINSSFSFFKYPISPHNLVPRKRLCIPSYNHSTVKKRALCIWFRIEIPSFPVLLKKKKKSNIKHKWHKG